MFGIKFNTPTPSGFVFIIPINFKKMNKIKVYYFQHYNTSVYVIRLFHKLCMTLALIIFSLPLVNQEHYFAPRITQMYTM